jgi:peptidoglycan hydrolase CwlO-like protein
MTKDTINKKIEQYGAKEFHLADAFLGASVMLAVIALWLAFAVPPKATKSEIATLEKRIEWLQDSNLDRIRDIGDVELQVLKLNNNLKDLKSDIKQYDSKLKAEANRDQFFEMIDRLIERADRDGVGQ